MKRDNQLSDGQKQLLQLFRESEDPVLTATEVAEEFEITQQAAHKRLSRLQQEGVLERKEAGARAVVWWNAPDQPECSC